jgi:hypothetical protein
MTKKGGAGLVATAVRMSKVNAALSRGGGARTSLIYCAPSLRSHATQMPSSFSLSCPAFTSMICVVRLADERKGTFFHNYYQDRDQNKKRHQDQKINHRGTIDLNNHCAQLHLSHHSQDSPEEAKIVSCSTHCLENRAFVLDQSRTVALPSDCRDQRWQ